jgi:serine/threonine protein kinase
MAGFPTAPREGDVLDGRFRIDGWLGQGGFGAVYAATQLNLQRKVALKVLRPDLIATDESRARFRREAEMAQRLEHPNTVRLFDFGGADDGMPYMAFELLHGRGLDAIIVQEGPQAEPRVARMASQVLKSLMEAHAKGIVHRDIKPSNIFLCDFPGEPDFAKVLDFGIAKPTQGNVSTVTSDGQVIGSPSYMSPEQVRGDAIDATSDLYSLGLVMAEMLTAQLVFGGPSAVRVLMEQASEAPVPLSAQVASSPLGPVIGRATQKRAVDRYRSAEEMLRGLESALRTASDHPVAYGATLKLGTSPMADSMPFAPTYAQPTPPNLTPPPVRRAETGRNEAPAPITTTSAATIESPGVQSTTIPISKPRLGWYIAGAAIGTSLLAGLAGGIGVLLMQRSTAPAVAPPAVSASAAPPAELPPGSIDISKTNPFNRGNAFNNINAAKIRVRAERAGWQVKDAPTTNIEGNHTIVTMVMTRGRETALLNLFIADDDRVADALELSAKTRDDAASRRDGTGVLVVTVVDDVEASKRLLAVVAGDD